VRRPGAPDRLQAARRPTPDGKLTPDLVEGQITGVGVEHHVQPRLVSIAQTTEYGTLYTPAEIRALADTAHAHGCCCTSTGRDWPTRPPPSTCRCAR
jgi:threonine aldolase